MTCEEVASAASFSFQRWLYIASRWGRTVCRCFAGSFLLALLSQGSARPVASLATLCRRSLTDHRGWKGQMISPELFRDSVVFGKKKKNQMSLSIVSSEGRCGQAVQILGCCVSGTPTTDVHTGESLCQAALESPAWSESRTRWVDTWTVSNRKLLLW